MCTRCALVKTLECAPDDFNREQDWYTVARRFGMKKNLTTIKKKRFSYDTPFTVHVVKNGDYSFMANVSINRFL